MSNRTKNIFDKYLFICILICLLVAFFSCTERQKKELKHFKSDLVGLKRQVTLYNYDGKIIKQWEGRFKIELQEGPILSWIDDNGKEIKIHGIFTVEEQ